MGGSLTVAALKLQGPRMPYEWKARYDAEVDKYLEKHFGGARGVTYLYAYTKPSYKWKQKDQKVADSRVVLKNNEEYHGLERHAKQYHASGQYQEAYEFWLMAAAWRRENMEANGFNDEKHRAAIGFNLRHYAYNKAWHDWEG